MKAVVLLKITSGEVREAYDSLKQLKQVIGSCMTFGRYDAMAIIYGESLEEIRRITISEIQSISGVVETLPCLIVEETSLKNQEHLQEFLKVARS
jgi:DNA-binding Lrp family transcriptional regulator